MFEVNSESVKNLKYRYYLITPFTKMDTTSMCDIHKDTTYFLQNWLGVIEDDASGEVTPIIKIWNIFSSRLQHTLDEISTIILASYLSFVQNLPKGNKMETNYEFTNIIFKVASLF